MEDFKGKYYRLKFLFVELSSKIDKLVDENDFFDRLGRIRYEINEIQVLKNELLDYSNLEEYHKVEPDLNKFAKEIKDKFDNIIELKRRDLNEILINIKNLQNSRKLVNYSR